MKKLILLFLVLAISPSLADGWTEGNDYDVLDMELAGLRSFGNRADRIYMLSNSLKVLDLESGKIIKDYDIAGLVAGCLAFDISADEKVGVFLKTNLTAVVIDLNAKAMITEYDFSDLIFENQYGKNKLTSKNVKVLPDGHSAVIIFYEYYQGTRSNRYEYYSQIIDWTVNTESPIGHNEAGNVYTSPQNDNYFITDYQKSESLGGYTYQYAEYNSCYRFHDSIKVAESVFSGGRSKTETQYYVQGDRKIYKDIIQCEYSGDNFLIFYFKNDRGSTKSYGLMKFNNGELISDDQLNLSTIPAGFCSVTAAPDCRYLLFHSSPRTFIYDLKYGRAVDSVWYNDLDYYSKDELNFGWARSLANGRDFVVYLQSENGHRELRKYSLPIIHPGENAALFSIDKPVVMQYDSLTAYENGPEGAEDYRWDWGDGQSSVGPVAGRRYELAGDFTATLNVRYNGQDYSTTRKINVRPKLRADFTLDRTEGISPLRIHVSSISSGSIDSCKWVIDGKIVAAEPEREFNIKAVGHHSVQLYVCDGQFRSVATKNIYVRRDTVEGRIALDYEKWYGSPDGSALYMLDSAIIAYTSQWYRETLHESGVVYDVDFYNDLFLSDSKLFTILGQSKLVLEADSIQDSFTYMGSSAYNISEMAAGGDRAYFYIESDYYNDIHYPYGFLVRLNMTGKSREFIKRDMPLDFCVSNDGALYELNSVDGGLIIYKDMAPIDGNGKIDLGANATVTDIEIACKGQNIIVVYSNADSYSFIEIADDGQALNKVVYQDSGYVINEIMPEEERIIIMGSHEGRAFVGAYDIEFKPIWKYQLTTEGTDFRSAVKISETEYALTGQLDSAFKFVVLDEDKGFTEEYELPEGRGFGYQICNSHTGGLFFAGRDEENERFYATIIKLPGRELFDFGGSAIRELPDCKMNIYPIPAGDHISIEHEADGVNRAEVQIYDMFGRRVRRCDLGTGSAGLRSHSMDIRGLGRGVYVMELRQGGALWAKAFVKE